MPGPSIDHLLNVGKTKALGLLTTGEIRGLGHSPRRIKRHFNDKSRYIVRHFKKGDMFWGDPVKERKMATIAVASIPLLEKVIADNREVITASGWPTAPEEFFDKSLQTYVMRDDKPHGAELQNVMIRAYGYKPLRP